MKTKPSYCNDAALRWVFTEAPTETADQLLVLASMGRHAAVDGWGNIFTSATSTAAEVHLTRKRVMRAWADLRDLKLIADTGERRGKTGKVIVWRLCREQQFRSGTIRSDETVPKRDHSMVQNSRRNGAATNASNGLPVEHRSNAVEVMHEQPLRARELPRSIKGGRTSKAVDEDEDPNPPPGCIVNALMAAGVVITEKDPRLLNWIARGYSRKEVLAVVSIADERTVTCINKLLLLDPPLLRGQARREKQRGEL